MHACANQQWGLSLAMMAESSPFARPAQSEDAIGSEPPSLEGLFRSHADDVFRIVARLMGPGAGDADIEDVTQQVFVAAQRALPRFRGDSTPLTWLYGIATRVVLTHLRSIRRHRRLVGALEAVPPASLDMQRHVEQREELRRVWRVLMRIKPKKRVVFVLHEIEGRSGREIAEALEIKEATVWSRLHHARRELVAGLRKEGTR